MKPVPLSLAFSLLTTASPARMGIEQPLDNIEAALLGPDGLPRVVPAAVLQGFSDNERALFCRKHALYQLATTELTDYLQDQIQGRSALEIGGGVGTVGRALGIHLTDSRLQEDAAVIAHYYALNQPPIQYPADVQKFSALGAIAWYKPQVVLGCWVTQLLKADARLTPSGNPKGVDEVRFMTESLVTEGTMPELYIHVGNSGTHQDKELLRDRRLRVQQFRFPWLYSRSFTTSANVIFLVSRK